MEFNSQTATAFARLIVSMAAAVAATFGWTLDADFLLNITLSIIAIFLFVYSCWWKNNNVTEAAQESQRVLDEIKAGSQVTIVYAGEDGTEDDD